MGVFNFLGSPHHFHKFLEIGSKTLLDIPGAKNGGLDVLPCVLILKHARLINSWLWRGGASIAAHANIHVLRRDRVPGRSATGSGQDDLLETEQVGGPCGPTPPTPPSPPPPPPVLWLPGAECRSSLPPPPPLRLLTIFVDRQLRSTQCFPAAAARGFSPPRPHSLH